MNFMNYPIFIDASNIITHQASLINYFGQSNTAGKFIVLVLLVCSIIAWSVIIGKLLDIRRLNNLNTRHQLDLNKASGVLKLDIGALSTSQGPHASVSLFALKAYARYGSVAENELKGELDLLMGHVENAIARAVADQTLQYESKMVLLGSIVAGAPFLGLLGTVWGVMDAFGAMSYGNSASLQSLAPGVAGALLTTVCGLLVAIPSVFGYNYLLQNTKISIIELENFASTISDRIELEARTLNN